MATEVKIPPMGESIKQALLVKWHKTDGQAVGIDEPVAELETDKANVDVRSPSGGVLRRMRKEGESVAVGEVIARVEEGTPTPAVKPPPAVTLPPAAPPAPPKPAVEDLSPAVRTLVLENKLDPKSISATGPGGRLTKQDVEGFLASKSAAAKPAVAPKPAATPPPTPPPPVAPPPQMLAKPTALTEFDARGIRREPMSKIRKRIAETLVNAQKTAAILTTFNEIDLTTLIDLRARYKERFQEVHGVGLGFMSFFARAVVLGLREFPRVNASIECDDTVYHNYVNLGIAVSTDRGLAVPVLRNVQDMSFGKIESEIKRLANDTREGKLNLEELSGATFTITNGGIFGSLLSTPILTPPQSGILGMHAIQKRPMVVGDKIEIRSMMYVALSYDHRLVDGRESVSFLVRVKQLLEDPARLMLEI
jgi:2-oxoglutarate dehydrogenase E2 component (dihydrolipoamide succinyltransferase)